MHPIPAEVTAWRYMWSVKSPAANTPGMLVEVLSGFVTTYPPMCISSWSLTSSFAGACPMATKTPLHGSSVISPVFGMFDFDALNAERHISPSDFN